MSDTPEPTVVAASLRAILATIEAGDVEAHPGEVAYLRGAADSLERLSSASLYGNRPFSVKSEE